MIERVYNSLDEKILQGANTLVRAYNWTTGGTKADLANKVVEATTISGCFGAIAFRYNNSNAASYIFSGLGSLLFLMNGHFKQEENREQIKLEEKAKEREMLSVEVEVLNGRRKIESSIQGTIGVTLTPLVSQDYSHPEVGMGFLGTFYGNALNGYIMRAENLPPRKNVFSRAKDKIKKYLENRKASPSTEPVPAPAFAYSNLENYLD